MTVICPQRRGRLKGCDVMGYDSDWMDNGWVQEVRGIMDVLMWRCCLSIDSIHCISSLL